MNFSHNALYPRCTVPTMHCGHNTLYPQYTACAMHCICLCPTAPQTITPRVLLSHTPQCLQAVLVWPHIFLGHKTSNRSSLLLVICLGSEWLGFYIILYLRSNQDQYLFVMAHIILSHSHAVSPAPWRDSPLSHLILTPGQHPQQYSDSSLFCESTCVRL